jgi:glutathione S-transferase
MGLYSCKKKQQNDSKHIKGKNMKLYGFSASNYYNAVKHLLLAKGLDFEEVFTFPNQEDSYLKAHPLGKVPALETEQGFLSETDVLMRYVDALEGPNFFPADPFTRGKCEELMKIAELYIELPARRHIAETLMDKPRCETAFKEARPLMERGLGAIDTLTGPGPYLLGDEMTAADIFIRYMLVVSKMTAHKIYDWKLLENFPKLQAWEAKMAESDAAKKVDADAAEAMVALKAYFKGKS